MSIRAHILFWLQEITFIGNVVSFYNIIRDASLLTDCEEDLFLSFIRFADYANSKMRCHPALFVEQWKIFGFVWYVVLLDVEGDRSSHDVLKFSLTLYV